MAWSRMESASRMEPSPASASRARASSSASMFSRVTRSRSWATMASNLTARKLKCWQRERNVFGLRGGEHEDDVVGWLFQRFEQGVECGVGDLVSFVENINLEPVAGGA